MEGSLTYAEAKVASDQVITEAEKLKSGFDVINDITKYKGSPSEAEEEIKRAQLFIKNHGVGKVIRLMDEVAFGAIEMEKKSREAGYQADFATSIEEAIKKLNTD